MSERESLDSILANEKAPEPAAPATTEAPAEKTETPPVEHAKSVRSEHRKKEYEKLFPSHDRNECN